MEEQVLRSLGFAVHHVSAIQFLERYFRIYGIDQARKTDKSSIQLQKLARQYCRYMQRDSFFLNYRPSQIAASSMLFAINVSQSAVAAKIGIK